MASITDGSTNRRGFLRRAMVAGGALAFPGALGGLAGLGLPRRAYAAPGQGGYGPLAPKPDLRDGALRVSLPEGFQYRSFGVAGVRMSDGNPTPLAHDGMAAF